MPYSAAKDDLRTALSKEICFTFCNFQNIFKKVWFSFYSFPVLGNEFTVTPSPRN